MKSPLLSLLLLISIFAHCQDSYILLKDGKRIEFQKNSVQIIVQDKILSYKTLSGSQKDTNFKDIDLAIFGNYKFKYFKFIDGKASNCYFVLCESDMYSLICLGTPINMDEESNANMKIKYDMYVIDKQNIIVDGLSFSNQNNSSNATARSLIQEKISSYFKSCEDLMTRLGDFEKLDEPQYLSLIGFFKVPNFVSCVK